MKRLFKNFISHSEHAREQWTRSSCIIYGGSKHYFRNLFRWRRHIRAGELLFRERFAHLKQKMKIIVNVWFVLLSYVRIVLFETKSFDIVRAAGDDTLKWKLASRCQSYINKLRTVNQQKETERYTDTILCRALLIKF